MALSFAGELREKGFEVTVEEGIHPQTYASFGRDKLKEFDENLKQGIVVDPIPFDKLGLYHGRKAKITEGKKK